MRRKKYFLILLILLCINKQYVSAGDAEYSSPNTQSIKAWNPIFVLALALAFFALLFGMRVCLRKRDR